MKFILIIILFLIPFLGIGQSDSLLQYQEAVDLLRDNKIEAAFQKFKEAEERIPKNDTLHAYALWNSVVIATHLQEYYRYEEAFEKSLKYAKEALDGIEKGIPIFDDEFAKRKYFMVKNIIVAHYGLGNFEEGKEWKNKMYQAKKENNLPEGIDDYFNYDFFRFEDKNVWGYEWFDELPKDRFSSSFTKVVYYVYSTHPDGSDKEQLYRFHVLMFHGDSPDFDYILEKHIDTEAEEISGTYRAFVYKENIDFEKLKNDVKNILKNDLQPDVERIMTIGEDGKTNVELKVKVD